MANPTTITLNAPAKINLVLLIEGLRADGYHSLFSIASLLSLQDELTITLGKAGKSDSLECPSLVGDLSFMADNLVLKAAHLFRSKVHFKESIAFVLNKKIPIGAGLGGGSTNAVAALKGLNFLLGSPLSKEELLAIAVDVGSDCPLFLEETSCLMRGRGEHVFPLPEQLSQALKGQRLLIFKPDFSVSTAWAYAQIKQHANSCYQSPSKIEAYYEFWQKRLIEDKEIECTNTFEAVIFPKYVALPVLLEGLREKFGVRCGMTGSGSACFAIVKDETPVQEIETYIKECWGSSTAVFECFIKG